MRTTFPGFGRIAGNTRWRAGAVVASVGVLAALAPGSASAAAIVNFASPQTVDSGNVLHAVSAPRRRSASSAAA